MKKKAIVTGATGAIGSAIARNILNTGDYHVTMIARNEEKAKRVMASIKDETGMEDIDYLIADLSLEEDIKSLAGQWKGPLHVLVNNAATTPRKRTENDEGIEMQFAVNVLGYLRMIVYFLEYLKEGAPARVVNVASYWAGNLDLGDLQFTKRRYDNDTAYRQSKQADRMLSYLLAEKLEKYGITCNAAHPGDVNSSLSNSLGYGGHESPDQGADTPVWLALSDQVEGVTGKYFENRQKTPCRFCDDRAELEKLLEICLDYQDKSL